MLSVRTRDAVLGLLAIGAGFSALRWLRGHASGRPTSAGLLVADPASYDRHSRLLFGSLFDGIAADIAAAASPEARILEVGAGPGHLSIRLARDHGLDVTALDLDAQMVERARANAERTIPAGPRGTFVVGDVAALPFEDATFDLVVSTFSMHHWPDPKAGLAEIARVLRPDGRALVWDLKPGVRLFHAHSPDPIEAVHGSGLDLVSVKPWRWPWRLTLAQRLALVRR